MKKMNKRLISILLSIVMVFGCVAVAIPALAAVDGYTQYNDKYHINSTDSDQPKFEAHAYGTMDPDTGIAVCTLCDHEHNCRTDGHVDADSDCECDVCGEDTHVDKNPQDHVCDICGESTHTWILFQHDDATCSTGDRYIYRCLTCGFTEGEFNCDEDGNTLDTSYGEGGVFKTIKIIPGYTMALGHYFDFSTDKVEITWTGLDSASTTPYVTATGKFTCARCGFTVTVTVENIEETSSGKIEVIQELAEPTCYSGITQYKATFKVPEGNDPSLFKTYTDTQVSSYGIVDHSPAEAVEENRVEPTCTRPGSYDSVIYCKFGCGTELSRETIEIPATGHTAGAAVEENRVEPKCEEAGKYDSVTYCSVCGEETSRQTITIPATGHTSAEPVEENKIDPTCTEDGSYDKVVYCSVCGKELSRESGIAIPATGHTPGEPQEENRVEPTCAPGSYEKVICCSVCGEELSRETIEIPPVDEHVFNDFGNCINCGFHDCVQFDHDIIPGYVSDEVYHWKTCQYCDEEIDKELHTDANKDGLCDVCNTEVTHNWQLQEHKDPTCTERGYDLYICINCYPNNDPNDHFYDYIPALGHQFTDKEDERYIEYVWDTTNYESCTIIFHCANSIYNDSSQTYSDCPVFKSYTVHQKNTDANNQVIKLSEEAPTCTEDGLTIYKATFTVDDAVSMGWKVSKYTFTTTIEVVTPALGHEYSVLVGSQAATCTDPAILTYKCIRCDLTQDVEDSNNPALDHDFVYVSNNDATCENDGTKTGYCSRCDAVDGPIPDIGSKQNHTPGEPKEENRVEPTCSEPGHYEKVIYCSICGHEISRELIEIPPTHDHEYNELGFCKVCGSHDCEHRGHAFTGGFETDDNYHWKVCSYCSEIDSDGIEVYNEAEGTYTIDGEKGEHKDTNGDGMCDVCEYSKGHKWQLISHTDPSCTNPGSNTYKCTFHQDEIKEVALPALGHYWYDDHMEADRQYVDFVFSDNYESCTLTFTCRRPECGATVSYTVYTDPTDIGAVLANATTNKPIAKGTDANCEAGSGKSYYAIFTISQKIKEMGLDNAQLRTVNEIINEDSELQDIVNANGLNPAINRDEKGLVCILTIEDGETPALGHIYEDPAYMKDGENYQPNGDATCTKDGTRTAPCDRCGKINAEVPDEGSALGHNFDESTKVIDPAPTCTTSGIETGKCTRCGDTTTNILPALGHDFEGNEVVTHEPTCSEQGYEEAYCNRCHQYMKDNFTPALGHNWGEWHVTKDPDCTNTGKRERSCQRCGDTQTEDYGAALGHSFVYSSTDDGSGHVAKCERCGYTLGSSLAHVDADYDFLCDGCGAELKFWQHWLHYMVGLPTHAGVIMSRAFGDFFTKVVGFFTKYMINF